MAKGIADDIAKLIITSAGIETERRTRTALKAAVPSARIRRTGFKNILSLEAAGDVCELAKLVCRECSQWIGHATAVLQEVESRFEPIKEAAERIARRQIGPEENFCFRIHKRGAHYLEKDTSTIEREIGGAIWTTLEEHGATPRVKLKNPDVAVVAEVLGPITAVGISRRAWREQPAAV